MFSWEIKITGIVGIILAITPQNALSMSHYREALSPESQNIVLETLVNRVKSKNPNIPLIIHNEKRIRWHIMSTLPREPLKLKRDYFWHFQDPIYNFERHCNVYQITCLYLNSKNEHSQHLFATGDELNGQFKF